MLKIKEKVREYIGKIKKVDLDIPNLLEIQVKSYNDFFTERHKS